MSDNTEPKYSLRAEVMQRARAKGNGYASEKLVLFALLDVLDEELEEIVEKALRRVLESGPK